MSTNDKDFYAALVFVLAYGVVVFGALVWWTIGFVAMRRRHKQQENRA